jgi:mono/diheme cytochrome c family protein
MPGERTIVYILSTLVVLLAGQPALAQTQGPGQNVLAGARVFGTKGCVKCHAISGLGGNVGPDLGVAGESRSFFDFASAMWNHLPGMATQMGELDIERPRLAPWETSDLVAFLFWHDYFDPPGDAERGTELFATKGCIACHQVGGRGGVEGPNLDFLRQYGSPIQIAAAMWNHGPTMTEQMNARGIRRPTFTNSELSDLIAYLKSASETVPEGPLFVLPGSADEGRRRFVEKGCIECHAVRGEGGRIGPDLAATRRRQHLLEFAAAMWNKAPRMLSAMQQRDITIPQLAAVEMADLLAYLYSVQYFGDVGNAQRGRRLVESSGCLGCHALGGTGGTSAPDLATARGLDQPVAVVAAMWNHILNPAVEEGAPASWPSFRPAEMADIAAFFQSLPVTR